MSDWIAVVSCCDSIDSKRLLSDLLKLLWLRGLIAGLVYLGCMLAYILLVTNQMAYADQHFMVYLRRYCT